MGGRHALSPLRQTCSTAPSLLLVQLFEVKIETTHTTCVMKLTLVELCYLSVDIADPPISDRISNATCGVGKGTHIHEWVGEVHNIFAASGEGEVFSNTSGNPQFPLPPAQKVKCWMGVLAKLKFKYITVNFNFLFSCFIVGNTFSKCSDLSAEYSVNISRNSTSFLQSKCANSDDRSLQRNSRLTLASAELEFAWKQRKRSNVDNKVQSSLVLFCLEGLGMSIKKHILELLSHLSPLLCFTAALGVCFVFQRGILKITKYLCEWRSQQRTSPNTIFYQLLMGGLACMVLMSPSSFCSLHLFFLMLLYPVFFCLYIS